MKQTIYQWLQTMRNQSNAPVLIVGAGPVGLTLGNTLMQAEVPFDIIDQRPESTVLPRAINISHASIEILSRLHCWDKKIMSNGLLLEKLSIYFDGKALFNIDGNTLSKKYPYFFHLEQPHIENALIEKLHANNIFIDRGNKLLDLKNENDQVDVTIEDAAQKITHKTYQFVVGCDGGHSSVKTLLGIKETRKNYDAYFALGDVLFNTPIDHTILKYYLTGNGYLILAPLAEKRVRVIASFQGNYSDRNILDFSIVAFEKLIFERTKTKLKINELLWKAFGPFFHRLAKHATVNNIFLVGDALHQFSPVGGTNMNTGIADAYTLGLKLSKVYHQKKSNDFLEGYEIERMIAAKKILFTTESATLLMTQMDENLLSKKKMIKACFQELFTSRINFNQSEKSIC